MNDVETLRSKWLEVAAKRLPYPGFDYDSLMPESSVCTYLIRVEKCLAFQAWRLRDSLTAHRDALAYIRFAEIPHILEWDSGIRSEEPLKPAEAYLSAYDESDAKQILELLDLIDRALTSDEITSDMLLQIRELFNQAFEQTNPAFQILAWGSLTETLSDPYFSEALEDAEQDESDETSQSLKVLKDLLTSRQFDENNELHLSLAREFFESCLVA